MTVGERGLVVVALAALLGAACSKGTPVPSLTSASPAPVTTSAAAITIEGVKADQPGQWSPDPKKWSVTISWQVPDSSFQVDHYAVTRDGKLIGGDVADTTFTDDGAEPQSTYHYSVVAIAPDGARSSPGTLVLDTHAPPLDTARMDGRFVVKFHITTQGNLTKGASGFGELFTFDPKCGSGPCDVSLSIKRVTGSAILHRSGTSYAGTMHAPFLIHSCHGGTLSENLVFHLRAKSAGPVHGEWRVTKFEGTLDETAPSSGCLTGHLAYALSGIVQS